LSEVLIQHCNQHRKNYANTNDVQQVLPTILERGEIYFAQMWLLAASPLERLLLSFMAQDTDEGHGKIFSLPDLQEALFNVDHPYEYEQVRFALQHLQQEELIEEQGNEGRLFFLPIGLIRAWINLYKAFERVAGEEAAPQKID
jgi:hypothetical protein